MSSLIKVLVILFVTALVAGCKVAVIVVEGGEVQSIGSATCLEGTICIVEVNDTNFSETFTAVQNPGWHFVKWHSGEGFLCGGSNDPRCIISTKGTAGNAGIESVIASDQTFYIMPIFEPGLATLTVDGKEWAQVDQFTYLSWNDINAVCPAGVCSGMLNGYDMTGWTWASVEDVSALFNHYIGSDELGPPPSGSNDCDGVRDFFSDGWRSLLLGGDPWIAGWAWGGAGADLGFRALAAYWTGEYSGCAFLIEEQLSYSTRSDGHGGWFWRSL